MSEPLVGPLDAIREAIELLTERKHGSHARSPIHNARLVLEAALNSTSSAAPAEAMETHGPYEARLCKDMPTDCCDYGIISLSEGREVCRVWREQDARAIAAMLASPPSTPDAAPVVRGLECANSLGSENGESKAPLDEIAAICNELGCTTSPGVALRFVQNLHRDLTRAHERHVELLRSWDEASPTERQELDRLRRGWGPSTPTERMARRTDLREAMTVIERAMDAVLPDDKADDDLTVDHFQTAYDKLREGYQAIIALLHAIPELKALDLPHEDGFTRSDFQHVAQLLRSTDDKVVRATASNWLNCILAALDRAHPIAGTAALDALRRGTAYIEMYGPQKLAEEMRAEIAALSPAEGKEQSR